MSDTEAIIKREQPTLREEMPDALASEEEEEDKQDEALM